MIDLTGYRLTFDDEFNRRSISQDGESTTWKDIRPQWRFDANSDIGFGHSSFVDPAAGYDPFRVEGGTLAITAVPDRTAAGFPGSWESGLITTQGTFSQTYGYFEIRADFAGAPGAWDAFWLLPDHQIPDPANAGGWQELDVVEHYGDWDRGVYSAIHSTDQTPDVRWQDNRQVYSELQNPGGYHTYGMNWQADRLSFYVDGQLVGSQGTPSDMHSPMHVLVNLATQASGTNNADLAGVPLTSRIDYVRVYSNDPGSRTVPQDVVSAPDGRDPGLYGAMSLSPRSSTGAGGSHGGTGDVVFGTEGNAASVWRLYQAAFDRTPDIPGLSHNVFLVEHALSLLQMADAFTISPEFQVRHGAQISDRAFVATLYANVLHRTPDSAGYADWTGRLASGQSRGDVLIGFSESPENHARVDPVIANGIHLDYGAIG